MLRWWMGGIAALLLAASCGVALAQGARAQTAGTPPPTPALVMVDMQQLIYTSKPAKNIQSQMETLRQAFSKEVAQQEDKLQKARAELERQRTVIPPDQLEIKGREFQQKLAELDRNVQARQQALQAVYNEAMKKVESAALQSVAEVAAEHQANIVIQKAAVIFSKDGFDITAEAMQKLDQRLPAVKVSQPKIVEPPKAKAPAAPARTQSRTQPQPEPQPEPRLNLQLQPEPQGSAPKGN